MARPGSKLLKLCENSRGYLFAKGRDSKQHWIGHTDDPESRQKYANLIGRLQRRDLAIDAAKPFKKHLFSTMKFASNT